MKKLKSLFCIVLVLLLTGCKSNINKVPYNEFEGIVGQHKYMLNNITNNYSYAIEAYAYLDDDAHIEYIETTKINEAKGMYMDDFTNVYNKVSATAKGEINNDTSWSTYQVKTDTECYFLFLYDKTYIYIEMSKSKEKTFDEIVDKLLS